MDLVRTLEEVERNALTLGVYLGSVDIAERRFAVNLVKRGTCFVAFRSGEGRKFYPSRFMGYTDNTMVAHLANPSKDGRVTTPALSALLGGEPVFDWELENEYRLWCERLGFTARERGSFGAERKYWRIG